MVAIELFRAINGSCYSSIPSDFAIQTG